MSAAGAVFANLIRREPSADELLGMEDVLDAAQEWAEGRLPWEVAANVGAMGVVDWRDGSVRFSAGYGRYVTLVRTPRSDRRWGCLFRLVQVLVMMGGSTVTTRGVFAADELASRGVTVRAAREAA